jgi:transposase
MLLRFQEKNLIKHRGKQRTDSTQVLAAIRQVNRLELVGETLRYALNEIAETSPEWLKKVVSNDWFARYSWRFDNYRLPKNKNEREQLALLIGFNGHYLLQRIWSDSNTTRLSLFRYEKQSNIKGFSLLYFLNRAVLMV